MTEQTIGTFVSPDEYAYHIGQVVSVGTQNLRVVRRNFSLTIPYKIEMVPVESVLNVEYKTGLAAGRIAAGVLLLTLLGTIVFYLSVYWSRLEPGTTVRVGLVALAIIYGLKWAFMSRRHKFVFNLRDGSRLKWSSRSGDYKYKVRVVENVIAHIRDYSLPLAKA
jgi:hypothetical protein